MRNIADKLTIKETFFGIVLLFAGAFAVSYLVMPGSYYRSGIFLSTFTMIYSAIINYYSCQIILNTCKRNKIVNYYDYYNYVLGEKVGNLVFVIFFLNSFLITVATLVSLNVLLADLMKFFTEIKIFTNPLYCFWALLITFVSTPFVYKSSDESMTLVTILCSTAIIMSLTVLFTTFFKTEDLKLDKNLKFVDFTGSVFSFDVSYFSFIVQLNIFDLYLLYSGSHNAKFNKIKKVAFYTNFVIFIPYFLMGKLK